MNYKINIDNRKITKLAYDIVQIALQKYYEGCKEIPDQSNIVYCNNEKFTFSRSWQDGWAWCAGFVSWVVDQATKLNNVNNQLPFTASTKSMFNGAKQNGLRVDRTPEIGSVGYRTRKGGGHVFVVADIDNNNNVWTVEGNYGDRVNIGIYPNANHKIEDHYFIHTEEMGNTQLLNSSNAMYTPSTSTSKNKYNPFIKKQKVNTAKKTKSRNYFIEV